MTDEENQRFATSQGLFGWKGLGKDKSSQTTIVTLALVVNYALVLYTLSTMGAKDADGVFRFTAGPLSAKYYLFCGVSLVACLISAVFIRYDDFSTRWGARLFACGLPAALIVILPFIWSS